MDVVQVRDSIETRHDLARFVLALRDDLLNNHDAWENTTLEQFLEALAGWIGDMEGYFQNQGIPEPEQPDWQLVGQMLFAASIYE
jgi:hypothetical protein